MNLAKETPSNEHAEANRATPARPPKWHLVYFLLAAFDLLAISISLYLNDRLIHVYTGSVRTNQEWAERLGRYSELGQSVWAVNAPGNDVFNSHDVDGESKRLAEAYAAFSKELREALEDLTGNVEASQAAPFLEDLAAIGRSVDAIVAEANQIFEHLRHNDPTLAGEHMASMDRKSAEAGIAVGQVGRRVRELQRAQFADQTGEAASLGRLEYVIAASIALIVCCVAVYGHKLSQQVAKAQIERERHLAALREAKLAADQASRAKGEFLANMSHEIRTPLNGAVGMLELLEATTLGDSQRRYLHGAQASVNCLMSLINDVLDFSKIEAGKIELDAFDFNLRELLEDVAEMMAANAQKKGLEICCDLPADLPPTVRGDADRLRQILFNLTGNAVKFTERGQIVLRARACDSPAAKGMYRFEVADTGIGIPEDRRHRLFKVFSQVDASTTRRYGGTGLGLALCKRLVELFGGEIGVDSTPGVGTTFWFSAALSPAATPAVGGAMPATVPQVRVLAVDDNATNLEITRTHLQRWGIECDVASGARAALRELEAAKRAGRPYGLAILDMQMPEMDGRELIESIRAAREFANLPLIMLTSIGEDPTREQLSAWRLAAYLNKPIRQSRLYDAIVSATCRREEIVERPIQAVESAGFAARGVDYQALVAEDNEINQIVIRETLHRLGVACTLVDNGRDAVDRAATRRFDLMLLDCQMPVLDGFAAAGAIRQGEAAGAGWARNGGRMPIVALTAHAIAGDRERCLEAGMDDYLTKPVDRQALQALLERYAPSPSSAATSLATPEAILAPQATSSSPEGAASFENCFQRAKLLETCFQDHRMADGLLEIFQTRAAAALDSIGDAAERGDRAEFGTIAHSLKGIAGNLAAPQLYALAARLERDHRRETGDGESLLADALALQQEINRCLAAAAPLRASLAAGA